MENTVQPKDILPIHTDRISRNYRINYDLQKYSNPKLGPWAQIHTTQTPIVRFKNGGLQYSHPKDIFYQSKAVKSPFTLKPKPWISSQLLGNKPQLAQFQQSPFTHDDLSDPQVIVDQRLNARHKELNRDHIEYFKNLHKLAKANREDNPVRRCVHIDMYKGQDYQDLKKQYAKDSIQLPKSIANFIIDYNTSELQKLQRQVLDDYLDEAHDHKMIPHRMFKNWSNPNLGQGERPKIRFP